MIEAKQQTISDDLLQSLVNRTDSFLIKDLHTLIDNALLHLWMSFGRRDVQFIEKLKRIYLIFLEDRSLSNVDFDYAFDEFKPISVKLLEDQTKKSNRMALHWSDIGGMDELKQELIQTIQWRFEVSDDLPFSS